MGRSIPEGFIKMYNYTNLTGASGIGDIFNYANVSTGYILANLFLFSLFFILLLSLKRFEFVKALASSCFSTFIVGAIMAWAGFLNPIIPLLFLFGTIFSGLILWLN